MLQGRFVLRRFVIVIGFCAAAGCGAASSSGGGNAQAPVPAPAAPPAATAPPRDAPSARSDIAALIRVQSPQPNSVVGSPLEVRGEARGTWYFEADFPVRLLASDGTLLIESYAQAQGEWMTEAFVPFVARLTFDAKQASAGTLVLERANPSDLPENGGELRIPVRFEPPRP